MDWKFSGCDRSTHLPETMNIGHNNSTQTTELSAPILIQNLEADI